MDNILLRAREVRFGILIIYLNSTTFSVFPGVILFPFPFFSFFLFSFVLDLAITILKFIY